jgi:hypothetical protein
MSTCRQIHRMLCNIFPDSLKLFLGLWRWMRFYSLNSKTDIHMETGWCVWIETVVRCQFSRVLLLQRSRGLNVRTLCFPPPVQTRASFSIVSSISFVQSFLLQFLRLLCASQHPWNVPSAVFGSAKRMTLRVGSSSSTNVWIQRHGVWTQAINGRWGIKVHP